MKKRKNLHKIKVTHNLGYSSVNNYRWLPLCVRMHHYKNVMPCQTFFFLLICFDLKSGLIEHIISSPLTQKQEVLLATVKLDL